MKSIVLGFTVLMAMTTASDATSAASMPSDQTPAAAKLVVEFWQQAGPSLWFAKDPEFDDRFRTRFRAEYDAAVRGELREWSRTPEGALALLILLDQYPRNSFRGTPQMYATDEMARKIADATIAAGFDRLIPLELRRFIYIPFAHSENLADQDRSVALARTISADDLAHAEHHRDIIRRFGRFPHRNAILGRTSTAEEQVYLVDGGYKG